MQNLVNNNKLNNDRINSCTNCNLQNICFTSGLSKNELATFESTVNKTFKISKKETLFSSGDQLTSFYAIKAGGIKTQLTSLKRNPQVIGFHLPGDLLGFDGFVNSIHTCDAVALEDTILCELAVNDFDDLCEKVPEVRKVIMKQVGEVVNEHHSLVLTLGQMSSEVRLSTYLYKLSYYYKSRGYSSTQFNLPMARSDLASYLGMASETLSRTFSKLEKNKILRLQNRNLMIINSEALANLTHELCMQAA